jgi:hypothetical protein
LGTNLFEPTSHWQQLAVETIIAKWHYGVPLGEAVEVQAYLGEKVVKEKEYLSAIASVDPGNLLRSNS